MQVFRLINKAHDSIEIGTFLTRGSNASNQKLADGMYFATTRDGASAFAGTRRYEYTHILTCELVGLEEADFIDLTKEPSKVVRWQNHKGLKTKREAAVDLCHADGKKGLIWKSQTRESWTELCLLTEHIPHTVRIEAAEEIP